MYFLNYAFASRLTIYLIIQHIYIYLKQTSHHKLFYIASILHTNGFHQLQMLI